METAARSSITVAEFIAHAPARLELRVLAGAERGAEKQIRVAAPQHLGLALAGFTRYVRAGRVLIVGQSETWFLGQLTTEDRRQAISNLQLAEHTCLVITRGLEPAGELLEAAAAAGLPLLQTPLISSVAVGIISDYLLECLAPRELRHGVLLELHGLGVLIEGRSGIGKSECALDLITRGHRLVSDDAVEIRRVGLDRLLGGAPDLLRDHLEIRGLGIINIKDLFGVSAISGPLPVGLSIKLERWEDAGEVDRLGIDAETVEILGVRVPRVLLPVSPGRNLSTLVETAVRVHLLRLDGHDAARSFIERQARLVSETHHTAGRQANMKRAGDGRE